MSRPTRSNKHEQLTGSPNEGEPVFLVVGKLRRPHGVRGEILMDVYTDFPERLKPGVTLLGGEQHRRLVLSSLRWHRQSLLVKFDGYQDREQVGEMRNWLVYVESDQVPPLPEGDFYHHQMIGLEVLDEAGEILGRVAEILETGANDILVVRRDEGADILLPVTDEIILNIDLAHKRIHVHLLPGILPDR
jgi:16S rRNA processing protein RimM